MKLMDLPYPDRRLIEQVLDGTCDKKHLPERLKHAYSEVVKATRQGESSGKKARSQADSEMVPDDMES